MSDTMTVRRDRSSTIAAMRRLTHVSIPHYEFSVDVLLMLDPEVIVAGIEGKAIVRAGMRRELRYIGEVP